MCAMHDDPPRSLLAPVQPMLPLDAPPEPDATSRSTAVTRRAGGGGIPGESAVRDPRSRSGSAPGGGSRPAPSGATDGWWWCSPPRCPGRPGPRWWRTWSGGSSTTGPTWPPRTATWPAGRASWPTAISTGSGPSSIRWVTQPAQPVGIVHVRDGRDPDLRSAPGRARVGSRRRPRPRARPSGGTEPLVRASGPWPTGSPGAGRPTSSSTGSRSVGNTPRVNWVLHHDLTGA